MTNATITPFAASLLLTIWSTAVLLTAEPVSVAPAEPPPAAAEPTARNNRAVQRVERVTIPAGAPAAPWHDLDTQYSADDLAKKILADPWLGQFTQSKQRKPKLQVGRIVVRADGEVIQTPLLLDKVQRALLASGKIEIIVQEEDNGAAPGGRKPGDEGDVLLNGSLTLERSTEGRVNMSLYTVTLAGTEVTSHQLLFSVETRVRKSVDPGQYIAVPNPPKQRP